MGHPASASGRCEGVQEVFTNEAADETRGAREDRQKGKRQGEFRHRGGFVKGFWHSFGTVLAQFWHSYSPNGDGRDSEPSGSALFLRKLWSHPPGLNRRPTDYESVRIDSPQIPPR